MSSLSAPSSTGAGAQITVSDTTKNQGTGAAGESTTRFFLSTNIALDAGDTVLGQRAVSALGPGVSDAGSVTLTIPTGVGVGTLFLIAQADADDAVVETADTNNTIFRTISIGTDLSVPLVLGPFTVAAGASITVTDTTKNGSEGAAGASTTAVYFSSNVFLDAGDPRLGSRAVPPLAGGASSQGATQVSIPTGLAPGFYYLMTT